MNRKDFIKQLTSLGMTTFTPLSDFYHMINSSAEPIIMPAIFIGHGSPMNALANNAFTSALNKSVSNIPVPKAILVISAHWLTRGSFVANTSTPKTIYDFAGFPEDLYKIKYPAPGCPSFAEMVKNSLSNYFIQFDHVMGFDHGTWSIMRHMYPNADIPTFQLSIDYTKPPQWHYELAKNLSALRHKGLLIVGSGNIVHNLGMIKWGTGKQKEYDWAVEFDEKVKSYLINSDHAALVHYDKMGKIAQLSVPTNDHYLPMLYINALRSNKDKLDFIYEDIEMGSISMRCFSYTSAY